MSGTRLAIPFERVAMIDAVEDQIDGTAGGRRFPRDLLRPLRRLDQNPLSESPMAAIVMPAFTPSLSSLDGGLVMRLAHFSAALPIVKSAATAAELDVQRALARSRRS